MGTGTNVKVVGFAAGMTTIIIWLLGFFQPELMDAAPTGLEAGITAVITSVVSYFFPGDGDA